MNPMEMIQDEDTQKMMQPVRSLGATVWNVTWTSFVFTAVAQFALTAVWLLLLLITYVGAESYLFMGTGATTTVAFLNFFLIPTAVFVWRLFRAKSVYEASVAQGELNSEFAAWQKYEKERQAWEFQQWQIAQQKQTSQEVTA